MKLTQSEIYKLTKYETAFRKGMFYYKNDAVKSIKKAEINSCEEYIEARVKGKHIYNVSIWAENNRVTHAVCDCPAFEKYEGICKHIAAVLFSFAEKEEVPADAGGSSLIAEEIIKSYKAREREKAAALFSAQKASLYPTLHLISKTRCSAGFDINLSKSYVIKDLCEFADNIKNIKETTYGKNASFIHMRTAFSPRSREYVKIIEEAAEENRAFNNRFNKYARLAELKARELELSGGLLDRLITASEGGQLDIEAEGETKTIYVKKENPRLDFSLMKKDGAVFVKTEKYMFLTGSQGLYIILGDTLYITDEGFYDAVGRIITSSESFISTGGFMVSSEDMVYFYNRIILQISPYANIFWEGINPSEYEAPETNVKFFVDKRGSAEALVVCRFFSKEEEYNPFKEGEKFSISDSSLEYEIRAVLSKYMPYITDEGEFFIEDEEDLFKFVSEGIEELGQFGEVLISERFEKTKIRNVPKISVGLSLKGDLLELDFFSEEFDLKELRRLLKSYQRKQKYHRLKDGSFFALTENSLADITEAADALGLFEKETDKTNFHLPKYRALYLDKVFSRSGNAVRDAGFRSLIRNIKSAHDADFEIPENLKNVLRPYQKQGFRWLKTMDNCGFGGILADDMGLGKSVQIISVLLSEKERGKRGTSLIVCPASLIYNWEAEIEKFAPELKSFIITGTSAERQEKLKKAEDYDVLITSYDLLKRDTKIYGDISFRYQIIDEAQYIKNHATQSARAVKLIKAKTKFALTGTPIENRLSELWSIFDFLMPNFLFSYQKFRKVLESPAVKDGDETYIKRIKDLTSPFILRRLKADVLKELPEKTEMVFVSNMEEEQRKLYAANVDLLKRVLKKKVHSSLGQDTVQVLSMLTRLRQLCCDPSLCYENYSGGSAKLESCMGLIREAISGGHKVLLFSQFTSMLEIIESRLEEEGIPFYTLTGATPKEERIRVVGSFQKDKTPVFLISLKAGGTGLNLTAADVVIHFDPWWNIAAQNQATDRTHRIGQKNTVTVYKLIAKDTIEEKILSMQKNKKALADSIITGENVDITKLTKEELINLLGG